LTRKDISSTSILNNINKILNISIKQTAGNSLNYGVQVGQGGLTVRGSADIIGNVYSNGPIKGDGLVTGNGSISGNVTVANSMPSDPLQTAVLNTAAPYVTITKELGRTTADQDLAQSFTVPTTGALNKIVVYIRRIGLPSDITLKIVADNAGEPTGAILATGTLKRNGVQTSFANADIRPNVNIQLLSGVTYWIVLDTGVNSSSFYQVLSNNFYSGGVLKSGNTSTNIWSAGINDMYFGIYTGGINDINSIYIGGNAWSNTVQSSTITGSLFCQTGVGNNKSCNTSAGLPQQVPMPISDATILGWKNEIALSGTHTGNYTIGNSQNASLGPLKIVGDLTIGISSTVTLTGGLWVTGDIIIGQSSKVKLTPSYGSNDGFIIADGKITAKLSSVLEGSGTAGGFIMLLTTSSSPSGIFLEGSNRGGILYAPNGTIDILGRSRVISATGYNINLNDSSQLIYDYGLSNSSFTTGPAGTFEITKWRESY
jgi:hypothetical protein